jgi:DNA-binding MarR family transcriptional regulator
MSAMHQFDHGGTLPLLYAAGVTTPQLVALEFVRVPRSVSTIAGYLGLSLPAASQTVERLVRVGYAVRTESLADRRVKEVRQSPAGRRLVARVATARAARFERSLEALSRATAQKLFRALGEALDELEAAAP